MNPQAAASTEADAAAARESLSPAVGTIRITYPDLHGIQRGKDIPAAELDRVARGGLAFCWAVMGTDLSHTPVVGGEDGYPDMVARPDLGHAARAAVGARRRRAASPTSSARALPSRPTCAAWSAGRAPSSPSWT